MQTSISKHLGSMEFGHVQQHENMTVIPLMSPLNHGPSYLTLKEALAHGAVTVTEVSEGGSVPSLLVTNNGDTLVLILDGEELRGAKQNRVLNTTVLLDARSKTVIPVSCTEHGRWSYESPCFTDSGNIMHHEARHAKHMSVSRSLRERRAYASDQGEVWDHVACLHSKAGTHSPTGAMSDAFAARKEDLDGYTGAFPFQPGCRGFIVAINGKVAGMEFVSFEPAYSALHGKLVSSYAMDALLSKRGGGSVSPDAAKAWLTALERCEETSYTSVALGQDFRYSGANAVGSTLLYQEHPVHMAFFAGNGDEPEERMIGSRARRCFRL